jgi:hypothetical protein
MKAKEQPTLKSVIGDFELRVLSVAVEASELTKELLIYNFAPLLPKHTTTKFQELTTKSPDVN